MARLTVHRMDGGGRTDPEEAGGKNDPQPYQAENGSPSTDDGATGTEAEATGPQAGAQPATAIGDTSLVDVSKSRLRVLKALDGTRRTASELARELELNKSTVHGYLQDLVRDGFVQRHEDDERLWVYYSLTQTGEAIVASDRLTLVVDLGTLTAFLASAALGIHELFLAAPPTPSGPGALGGPSGEATGGLPWKAIAYAVLLGLVALGTLLHVHLRRRTIEGAEEAAP